MSVLRTSNHHTTEQILTPIEVAWILRCSLATVYRLIRDESLPAFRIGRKYRISLPLLRRWIETQSSPEQDQWSRSLEAVSEAMRREVLRQGLSGRDLSQRIAFAVARVRAPA